MLDSTMTTGLIQVWSTVTDAGGRTRLESRWTTPETALAAVADRPTAAPAGIGSHAA